MMRKFLCATLVLIIAGFTLISCGLMGETPETNGTTTATSIDDLTARLREEGAGDFLGFQSADLSQRT